MARAVWGMVSHFDLRYMINNEGLLLRSNFTDSHLLATKSDVLAHTYADPFYFSSYANNQTVPYHLIIQGIYSSYPDEIPVAYTSGSFELDIENPNGNSLTITDNQSWLSVSPSISSSTSFNITVTRTLNSSPSSRNGIVTVTDTLTGAVLEFEIQQQGQPGVATDPVLVGYGSTQFEACSTYPEEAATMYVPDGQTFVSATNLYSNSLGNVLAPSGWYSDGYYSRNWNGTGFLITNIC